MGFLSGIFRSRDKPSDRTAGSSYSFFLGGTASGKYVTERSAMQMTAVYCCVRILSEAVASLPLQFYRYTDDGGKEKAVEHPLYFLLHDEPNPEMTSFIFRETLMTHLLLWGNAYSQIIRNGKGEIVALYPLMPDRMRVDRDEHGRLYYEYTVYDADDVDGRKGTDKAGRTVRLQSADVLHIPGLGFDGLVGYSPIAMAKNAIGLAIATEEYGSKFFANGAAPSGVLEHAIDSSTPGGKLTLTILSAVAEIERENINVQFMSGKMQKLLNGGWPGGAVPYGYRNVNKELVIEPSEAKIVNLIFEKYIQDDGTLNGVAIWLNDNGYTRISKGDEKSFTYDFIVNVLDNPVYHGKLNYNRRTNLKGIKMKPKDAIEVDGIHEAIVSDELWQQVRDKREACSANNDKVDEPERVSLLSGLIKCPACGNGLIASKNKHVNKNRGGHYKTIHYYSCRYYRKSAGRTCGFKHTYNQAKIDSAVYEIVSNLSTHPVFEEALAKAYGGDESVEAYEKRMRSIRKDLYHQEHEKNCLGAELDNLDVLSASYDSDYERLQDEIDMIYDRIESLEMSLRQIKKRHKEAKKGLRSFDGIRTVLQNFGRFFEKMTCEEQRELYRQFIERIEVYLEEQEDGRVLKSIYFRFPVRYGEKDTIETWLASSEKPDEEIAFVLDCGEVRVTVAEAKATYAEIRAYVLEHTGMKVSSLYIAQVKRKYGIDIGKAYNKPEKNKNRVPTCPKEKELAIMDALKAFRMLAEDTEYMEAAL